MLGSSAVLLLRAQASAESAAELVGPFGRLRTTEVLVEPPYQLVRSNYCPLQPDRWTYPHFTRERLHAYLAGTRLAPDLKAAFLALATCTVDRCVIEPRFELIERLGRGERAELYGFLARFPQNPHPTAFRWPTAERDRWFAESGLSPATLALIDRLSYDEGRFTRFVDLPLVCSRISDPQERSRLIATLSRLPSMLVHVRLGPREDFEKVLAYWSKGRRGKSLRPFLEAVAQERPEIALDVAHLLPRTPRMLLYTYPEHARPEYNCFWTAMNFFRREPDDRFIHEAEMVAELDRAWVEVPLGNLELGDVLVLTEPQTGRIGHVVNHVAAGIVFTKNGASPWRPWGLMSFDEVKDRYPFASQVRAFRPREEPPE